MKISILTLYPLSFVITNTDLLTKFETGTGISASIDASLIFCRIFKTNKYNYINTNLSIRTQIHVIYICIYKNKCSKKK